MHKFQILYKLKKNIQVQISSREGIAKNLLFFFCWYLNFLSVNKGQEMAFPYLILNYS